MGLRHAIALSLTVAAFPVRARAQDAAPPPEVDTQEVALAAVVTTPPPLPEATDATATTGPVDPCAAVFASLPEDSALRVPDQQDPANCHELAVELRTFLSGNAIRPMANRTAPAPWAPEAQGGSGTPGQLAAAPGATPVPLIGGAVGFVGAADGPRLVVGLAVNPGSLAANAVNDAGSVVTLSRLLDVSVVLPITIASDVSSGAPLDFFGARFRINVLAWGNAETATRVTNELAAKGAAEGLLDEQLTALLSANPTSACASALIAAFNHERVPASQEEIDVVERNCHGEYPEVARRWTDVEDALSDIVDQVRHEADRFYLGADVRYDYGDATLTRNANASQASTLLAAFAAGGRVWTDRATMLRIRSRAGVQYSHVPRADPTQPNLNPISLDGGLALELELPLNDELLRFSAGVEGRGIVGTDRDMLPMTTTHLTNTEFLDFRVGVLVPFGGGPGVGIDISVPMLGGRAVQVAVSGDFSLLVPR